MFREQGKVGPEVGLHAIHAPLQATCLLREMAGVSSEQGMAEQNARVGGSRGNIRVQDEPSHCEHASFLHLFFINVSYLLRTSTLREINL